MVLANIKSGKFANSKNKITTWCEFLGDPNNPCVLLIGCNGIPSTILWANDFCNSLVIQNKFVIKYDFRDTGKSTRINFSESPYTLIDLTNDVIFLLNALKIKRAHIVGMSLGGYIAQLLAIYFPKRIISYVSFMSTCDCTAILTAIITGKINKNAKLPLPAKEVLELFKKKKKYSFKSSAEELKKEVIYDTVNFWKIFNGSVAPFEENFWYNFAKKVYESNKNQSGFINHFKATYAGPLNRTEMLKKTNVPALILHGSEDPVLPLEHAIFTAKTIPNSKLTIIDGMGHAMNPYYQNKVLNAVIDFQENRNQK